MTGNEADGLAEEDPYADNSGNNRQKVLTYQRLKEGSTLKYQSMRQSASVQLMDNEPINEQRKGSNKNEASDKSMRKDEGKSIDELNKKKSVKA